MLETESEESLCSRGIPGWQKVNRLAQVLIGVSGLSVSHSQATEIKNLYDNLLQRPSTSSPMLVSLARSKGGHAMIDQTKQYGY